MVGVISTHIDCVLGCGEPDVLPSVRGFSGHRSGDLKVQGKSFVRVGMEVSLANDFPAQLAQEEFTKVLRPIPASRDFWAASRRPLSFDDVKVRQCESGGSCWRATV